MSMEQLLYLLYINDVIHDYLSAIVLNVPN